MLTCPGLNTQAACYTSYATHNVPHTNACLLAPVEQTSGVKALQLGNHDEASTASMPYYRQTPEVVSCIP